MLTAIWGGAVPTGRVNVRFAGSTPAEGDITKAESLGTEVAFSATKFPVPAIVTLALVVWAEDFGQSMLSGSGNIVETSSDWVVVAVVLASPRCESISAVCMAFPVASVTLKAACPHPESVALKRPLLPPTLSGSAVAIASPIEATEYGGVPLNIVQSTCQRVLQLRQYNAHG
jgi:hypothetical protein